MKKSLKYLAIALAALLALLAAAAAIIAATFNPNDYKPLIIRQVQERTQRTLAIPGDIKLSFFPKLGADFGQVSLSEHAGTAEFASVERARVSLALVPLLSRQLVVDRVQVDGLRASLKRNKDGTTNFDDLLPKDESKSESKDAGGQALRFDIDSVHVSNAQLRFDDRMKDRVLELHRLKLDTGRLAIGVPGKLQLGGDIKLDKPAVDATIAFNTGFSVDIFNKRYGLKGIDGELKGSAMDWRDLALKLSGDVDAQLDSKQLASPQITIAFSGKQGERTVSGSLATPMSIDLGKHLVELPKITANLSSSHPGGGALALKAGGTAGIDLAKESVNAHLKGSVDDSGFEAKLGMTKFSSPLYTFDVAIDKLDLDRYQDKKGGEGGKSDSAKSGGIAAPAAAQKNPQDSKPADLSGLRVLRNLHADGSLRVGALKVKNIRTANARLGLHAAGGRLEVNPLALELYGGRASGSMALDVGQNANEPLRFATRQNLAGIDVGSLLKDAAGKDTLEGRGDVQIDVNANGDDIVHMKKTLAGTARLELRDGAVRGVNIAQAVREAKAKIGLVRGDAPPQSGTSSTAEKTDFSALGASFRIAGGIAHNDDLAIKSPLLRIAGAGDVNIGEDRLDYTLRATVVPTLEGQGGPELQALRGVTVPVKLAGPFAAISWRIDFAGMASELAKQKVDEKKEELRTRAQKEIDEQKAKIGEQLKDQLKGLFGK